jgi:hypothetical protein
MAWYSAPPDTLLDVDATVEHWRVRGLLVHPVSERRPAGRLPDGSRLPGRLSAMPWDPPSSPAPEAPPPSPPDPEVQALTNCTCEPWADPRVVAAPLSSAFGGSRAVPATLDAGDGGGGGVYLAAQPLSELLGRARAAVANAARRLERGGGDAGQGRAVVVLSLPCTLFATSTRRLVVCVCGWVFVCVCVGGGGLRRSRRRSCSVCLCGGGGGGGAAAATAAAAAGCGGWGGEPPVPRKTGPPWLRSSLPLAAHVALGLPFNRRLRSLAAHAVRALGLHGARRFNGVHLRVEGDAGDWAAIMGGTEVCLPSCLSLSRRRSAAAGAPAPGGLVAVMGSPNQGRAPCLALTPALRCASCGASGV